MIDSKKRRSYDEPFKRQIVRRLIESAESVSSFALSLGIDRTNLQKWKKIYGPEFTETPDNSNGKTIGLNEYLSLKKEFALLKETVDGLRAVVKKNFESKYIDG
jgi:transposase-like protein